MAAAESCNLIHPPTWRVAAPSSKPGASRATASLHMAPLKTPPWAAGQEMFCCFDTLSASTVTWVSLPGLVQRPALARPPPGTTQLTPGWDPEPSTAHRGQATNSVLLPPLAKPLEHRADLGRALSASRIIQLGCIFLAEGPLRECIRIFKEQEQILS